MDHLTDPPFQPFVEPLSEELVAMASDLNAQANGAVYTQQISQEEYDRQALEYTTAMVEALNADVRMQPEIGAKSAFFQDEENVKRGLPIFQGKHTRFVYDDDDEEIVGVVEVPEAAQSGPKVRTVADLDSDDEDEDEDFDEEEQEYDQEDEEEQDDAVANTFFSHPPGAEDEDMQVDEASMGALLEDVAMELASVALDEQRMTDMTARMQQQLR